MESDDNKAKTVIGRLISDLRAQGKDAFARLTPELYERLRQLSRRNMSRERRGHTMQPTEVVHEALARLKRQAAGYNDTKHFYLTVATQMRWVLVEYARHRRNKLRPGTAAGEDTESAQVLQADNDSLLLELHDALTALEQYDPTLARACELHYFGGHSQVETAVLMGISEATVQRKLRLAKAWLSLKMQTLDKRVNDES